MPPIMEFGPSAAVRDLRSSIDHSGFAVVRSAVARELANRFLEALDLVYRLDASGKIRDLPENERRALDRGDVWPNAFGKYTTEDFDAYYASSSLLTAVTKDLLVRPQEDMHTFLTVSDRFQQSIKGIGMHTDGIVQGTVAPTVAMWSPLHRCGIDAPGLSLVPASRASVLAYLQKAFPDKQIPGWHSETEWASAFEEKDLKKTFAPPITPELEPGDVVLFTNWTIHGSQAASGHRSAIVQRWQGKKWRRHWFEAW